MKTAIYVKNFLIKIKDIIRHKKTIGLVLKHLKF